MNDALLTAADRHVALTLSLRMDLEGGSCHPSTRTLAAECARKRDTVIASVQRLEVAGYLDVKRGVKRSRTGWSSDVNRYTATLPNGAPQVPVEVPAPGPPRGRKQVPLEGHKYSRSTESAPLGAALSPNETDWMDAL